MDLSKTDLTSPEYKKELGRAYADAARRAQLAKHGRCPKCQGETHKSANDNERECPVCKIQFFSVT